MEGDHLRAVSQVALFVVRAKLRLTDEQSRGRDEPRREALSGQRFSPHAG